MIQIYVLLIERTFITLSTFDDDVVIDIFPFKNRGPMAIYLNMLRGILLFIALLPFIPAEAQEHYIPKGLNYKVYNSIQETLLPAVDSVKLSEFNSISRETKKDIVSYNFKSNFTPSNSGVWHSYVPGTRSWFLKLRSHQAFGMALVLSNVKLLPGEKLYTYNLQGINGSFDHRTIPASGIIPTGFLKGDEIMIEFVTSGDNAMTGGFVIGTVSHAFDNVFGGAGECNIDIECADGVFHTDERRSVVKMVIHAEGFSRLCTGTLVNNTAQDNAPYILTAQHCVANQEEADRTLFTFNYEKSLCNGPDVFENHYLMGSSLKATLYENDYSLLELYNHPPLAFKPYYAGWDLSDRYLDFVTCIHHPGGGPKKVSVFTQQVTSSDFNDGTVRAENAFWKIFRWDRGVTEGGSSGAPLFNKNGSLMGTLTGGSSSCGSPYYDYFQRLSQSWETDTDLNNQLKYWLDPILTGVSRVEGLDPFKGINPGCDTITSISTDEELGLSTYPGGGYFSGYNADNIASFAERMFSADSVMLTGINLWVGSINKNSPGGIVVTVHANDNGIPGASLYETYVPYNRLNLGSSNFVGFYPYVNIKGSYFISYTISYSPFDTFALEQVVWRQNGFNSAYIKLASGWAPITAVSPNGWGSSLGIEAIGCEKLLPPVDTNQIISFYPNPATYILVSKLPVDMQSQFGVHVFDLQGREQAVAFETHDNNLILHVASLSAGMYLVRITSPGKSYTGKFIKTNL